MNKICIVGDSERSYRTDIHQVSAINEINKIILAHPNDVFISGHSVRGGIDMLAEKLCEMFVPYPPLTQDWEGYKCRNIDMVNACDKLYCIVIRGDSYCYHHNVKTHHPSGACWTEKYASKLGKITKVIEI